MKRTASALLTTFLAGILTACGSSRSSTEVRPGPGGSMSGGGTALVGPDGPDRPVDPRGGVRGTGLREGQGSGRVVEHEWSFSEARDLEGRIAYGCLVPAGTTRSGHSMDMFVSKDGKCLVWYVHVWATKVFVRQVTYRLEERSGDGRLAAEHVISDPAGVPVGPEEPQAERTADELFGIEREADAGLRRDLLPLSKFPLRVEWQVVAVTGSRASPTWLAENDRRVVLSGGADVRQDRPPPPRGSLSEPSVKIQLCADDLRKLLDRLEGQTAREFDLLLRVGPAAGAQAPEGFVPDGPEQFEARVPITRKRIEACLVPR